MGKSQLLELAFINNVDNVCYAGQEINGMVRLRIDKAMKAREVRLEVEGAASTHWTESNSSASSSLHRTILYSGNETYLSNRIRLWPSDDLSVTNESFLQPSSYEFPFKFVLPTECPSSFEGSYGNIRYFCKVVIDRRWEFDHKLKVPFTVIGLADLNQEPDATKPIHEYECIQLGCLCCLSGSVECNVDIERSGFVPGESIPLNFEIFNKSSYPLTSVKAELIENVEYKAKHISSEYSRTASRVVTKVKSTNVIGPGGVRKRYGKFMLIPAIAPTLTTCSIIRISYELQIKVEPDGCCNSSLNMFLAILIGSIPLAVVYPRSSRPDSMPHTITTEEANQLTSAVQEASLPFNSDMPPPIYEEAIFGGYSGEDEVDDRHTYGPADFIPRYPTYRFLSHSSQTTPV